MTVVIREDDEQIDVRMTPVAQELKAIVVRGRRSGVLGVIQDVDDQPVPNALVTVLGGASATTSDSLGRFSLPSVPAGTFMLMVRKRGYFAVKRSVTLPVGAALDISVLLAAVPRNIGGKSIDRLAGFGGILDMAWDAHASRRIRCAGGNAIFVPREQLAEQRGLRLDFALPRAPVALNRGFGRAELRTYALYIDGLTAEGWPLSAIHADEVEAVEVYRGVSTRTPLTVVPGSTTPSSQAFAASTVCPNGSIWVWLR
jgi:hypothetical protein